MIDNVVPGPGTPSRRPRRPAGPPPRRPAPTARRSPTSTWRRARRSPARSRTSATTRDASWSSRTPSPTTPQDFPFTAGGGISPASFLLDDDGSNATRSPTPGSFIVSTGQRLLASSESALAGWFLASATCSDGSPVSNIDVGPAETVTCTFVNRTSAAGSSSSRTRGRTTRRTSLSRRAAGSAPSTFQLDDDGNESNGARAARGRSTSVPPGSGYSVAESVPSGWTAGKRDVLRRLAGHRTSTSPRVRTSPVRSPTTDRPRSW